jgi:hypothetical protein
VLFAAVSETVGGFGKTYDSTTRALATDRSEELAKVARKGAGKLGTAAECR